MQTLFFHLTYSSRTLLIIKNFVVINFCQIIITDVRRAEKRFFYQQLFQSISRIKILYLTKEYVDNYRNKLVDNKTYVFNRDISFFMS